MHADELRVAGPWPEPSQQRTDRRVLPAARPRREQPDGARRRRGVPRAGRRLHAGHQTPCRRRGPVRARHHGALGRRLRRHPRAPVPAGQGRPDHRPVGLWFVASVRARRPAGRVRIRPSADGGQEGVRGTELGRAVAGRAGLSPDLAGFERDVGDRAACRRRHPRGDVLHAARPPGAGWARCAADRRASLSAGARRPGRGAGLSRGVT